MEIKAIETHYNGYKFRSRLEARWAVFFDEAGIKYQYEPEGFTNGEDCYLPDFYLPEHNTYVEVKPPREGYEQEIKKALKFVNSDLKIKRLLILQNIPKPNDYASWFLYPVAFYNSLIDNVDMQYVQLCRFDGEMWFKTDLYYLKRIFGLKDLSAKNEDEFNLDGLLFEEGADEEDVIALNNAYTIAREAQFERWGR